MFVILNMVVLTYDCLKSVFYLRVSLSQSLLVQPTCTDRERIRYYTMTIQRVKFLNCRLLFAVTEGSFNLISVHHL